MQDRRNLNLLFLISDLLPLLLLRPPLLRPLLFVFLFLTFFPSISSSHETNPRQRKQKSTTSFWNGEENVMYQAQQIRERKEELREGNARSRGIHRTNSR
jgi:hypothetical protein